MTVIDLTKAREERDDSSVKLYDQCAAILDESEEEDAVGAALVGLMLDWLLFFDEDERRRRLLDLVAIALELAQKDIEEDM